LVLLPTVSICHWTAPISAQVAKPESANDLVFVLAKISANRLGLELTARKSSFKGDLQ
jgi:hypothetical protein